MNETLKFEEIPTEVIQELRREYDTVTFENYGAEFTPECKTRGTTGIIDGEVEKYGVVMDPETFAPVILENAQIKYGFKIRGVFAEDMSNADIYSVSTIRAYHNTPDTIVHRTTDPDYDDFLAHVKEYRDGKIT